MMATDAKGSLKEAISPSPAKGKKVLPFTARAVSSRSDSAPPLAPMPTSESILDHLLFGFRHEITSMNRSALLPDLVAAGDAAAVAMELVEIMVEYNMISRDKMYGEKECAVACLGRRSLRIGTRHRGQPCRKSASCPCACLATHRYTHVQGDPVGGQHAHARKYAPTHTPPPPPPPPPPTTDWHYLVDKDMQEDGLINPIPHCQHLETVLGKYKQLLEPVYDALTAVQGSEAAAQRPISDGAATTSRRGLELSSSIKALTQLSNFAEVFSAIGVTIGDIKDLQVRQTVPAKMARGVWLAQWKAPPTHTQLDPSPHARSLTTPCHSHNMQKKTVDLQAFQRDKVEEKHSKVLYVLTVVRYVGLRETARERCPTGHRCAVHTTIHPPRCIHLPTVCWPSLSTSSLGK